jgi:hypothetical protein
LLHSSAWPRSKSKNGLPARQGGFGSRFLFAARTALEANPLKSI